ncbi:MAG: type II toxin-antitoxin system VapC family toxin [Acidimicrobiales bacterium]
MLIVDAGPLYAAAARSDRNHRRSVELLSAAPRPILVPALVVTEVAYLLADRIGTHAEVAFSRSIADGELVVEPVLDSEWARVAELTEQYLDLPLGIVDASVVVLAERHGAEVVATLDRRHFAAIRPRHVALLTLVP